VQGTNGNQLKADFSFLTASSVLFDAVFVPGGEQSVAALSQQQEVQEFLLEAYKHCKTIGAGGGGVGLLATTFAGKFNEPDEAENGVVNSDGIVISRNGPTKDLASAFIEAVALHRHWARETGP